MAGLGGSLVSVTSAQANGVWGTAINAAGVVALNVGDDAAILQISCSSGGNCGAIGSYTEGTNDTQAFVMNEVSGTWQSAIEIPGLSALNTGDAVGDVLSISCTATGSCSGGGQYTDSANEPHAFVVDETGGSWGTAVEIPGFASLDTGGLAGQLFSIWCTSPGNCSGGGAYGDGAGNAQAFVVDEANGVWGNAMEVLGSQGLNAGGLAFVSWVGCSSPGNCAADGTYTDASNLDQDFVVSEANGTWGNAIEIPGLATLNVGSEAAPPAIWCSSNGNCSASGTYTDAANHEQAFVADEAGGTWSGATEIPGTSALNLGGNATATDLACSTTGNCSVVGFYTDGSNHSQAFVANEANGTWASAIEIPGTGALNADGLALATAIDCSADGICSAGGAHTDASNKVQAFVVNETDGTWASAVELPGTFTATDTGQTVLDTIACGADGSCAAGGEYLAGTNGQAFVADSLADVFVPVAPSFRVTSPAKGVLSISLRRATADGGDPITSYQYSLNGGRWINVAAKARETIRVSHLTPSKKYSVRMRAVNVLGTGALARAPGLAVA
jgi:hypothetical protein